MSTASLTKTELAQIRASGKRYDGKDLVAKIRLSPDERTAGSFAGTCESWHIVDGGVVVYDVCLYMGDSGTMFRANTTKVVAEIVQGGLECSDPALRVAVGAAMVEAKLISKRDSSYKEFAAALATSKRR